MKKVTIIATAFLFVFVAFANAQRAAVAPTAPIELLSKLTDGKNTLQMPDNQGSFTFVKRGDRFSDVVFTDTKGKTIRLAAKPAGTNGLPDSPCKYPLPDACFGSAGAENVAMCFCRPSDVKSGDQTYTVRAVIFCRKAGSDRRMD